MSVRPSGGTQPQPEPSAPTQAAVADFVEAPSELKSLPEFLQRKDDGHHRQARRPPKKNSSSVAGGPLKAMRAFSSLSPRSANDAANPSGHSQGSTTASLLLPSEVQRLFITEERVVAIPHHPTHYCRDLVDEEGELVVVEMKASPSSGRRAWLEDDEITHVLIGGDVKFLVLRTDLRALVMHSIPPQEPTRNLRRALSKLCAPQGANGPVVMLLSVADILVKMPAIPYGRDSLGSNACESNTSSGDAASST